MSCCENFGIDEKGNYTYTAYATDERGSNFSLVRTDVNIKREFVAILSSREKLDEKDSKFKEYFQGRFFNIKDLEPEVLKRVTKEEHNSDVSKLRVEMKELSVGINGQIHLNSPKPTKNGQYIAIDAGEYVNLLDKDGNTIKVTEEENSSGIVYIVYNGEYFEKNVVNILANGEVKEGDVRAVSGGEVFKFRKNEPNLFIDSYFKYLEDFTSKYANVYGLSTVYPFKINDFDSKYRKSISIKSAIVSTFRFRFKISDLGLLQNDTFAVSMLINATLTSRGRFHVLQLNDSFANISTAKYSNEIRTSTDYLLAKTSDVIVTGCEFIDVILEKHVGDDECFFTGLCINKGESNINFESPNTFKKSENNSYTKQSNGYKNTMFPNRIVNTTSRADMSTNITLTGTSANVGYSKENTLNLNKESIFLSKTGVNAVSSVTIRNSLKWQYETPTSIILPFYIKDNAQDVANVLLTISSSNGTQNWSRGYTNLSFNTGKIKNGWNFIKWNTANSNLTDFGVDITLFKIDVYCAKPIDVYFSGVYFEYVDKAKMLFVNDHGRSGGWLNLVDGQIQNGIKDCEDIGMKVTFALNPKHHENGEPLRFTIPQLEELKNNNIAYFSFHSYEGTATRNMTPIQLQNDAKKSINWLQSKGFGKPSWRACFTQNVATNGASNFNFMGLDAIAEYKEGSGSFNCFPLINRNGVARFSIHGRSKTYIDTYFDNLKKLRGVTVPYTHAILPNGDSTTDAPFSITLDDWKYFISKCTTAKNEGWLVFVSYDDLLKELEDNGLTNDESIIERYFNLF